VDSAARPEADRARDKYRHPEATLMFWGLKPGITVVDLQPGGGYWTQILGPYLLATHGHYIGGGSDKSRAGFVSKFADKARYGDVSYVVFDATSPPFAPANSVDMVVTSREIHNWIGGGYLDRAMAQAYAALKPGGILAVEEHRADPKPQAKDASTGYVATQTVMDAAAKAGFKLDGASEVNANPKDTKDYPFGVWTLPPTRQSAPGGQPANPAFDHAKYDAIGESDRMTLRFRKPV
jgi:predicted methyltransferase